jgi:hypothetical protein
MKDLNLYYDNLIQYGIATQEEINLVTNINGWNKQTFNDILYVKTGCRDWEQYKRYRRMK